MFYLAIGEHKKLRDETDMKEMIKKKNERDSLVGPRGLAEYVIDIIIAVLIAGFMAWVLKVVVYSKNDYVTTMVGLKADASTILSEVKAITKDTSQATKLVGAPMAVVSPIAKILKRFNFFKHISKYFKIF